MNKSSHITLAQFLMEQLEVKELNTHRRAFLMGSILPDCRPSFITTRHTIPESFHLLKAELIYINHSLKKDDCITASCSIHVGIVIHYLADYFTYPHNLGYCGSMKEHIEYERNLMTTLIRYLEESSLLTQQIRLHSIEAVIGYIFEQHELYLNERNDTRTDCCYITKVCHTVLNAVLNQQQLHSDLQDGQTAAA